MTNSTNLSPLTGTLTLTGFAPTVSVSANLSAYWYQDARHEAEGRDAEHSTRREIVFAASFLETYLFEWARGLCAHRLNEFFPTSGGHPKNPLFQPSLVDRWKLVPTALYKAGIIPVEPTLDLRPLRILMEYRNGLTHGRASRPFIKGAPPREQPIPAIDELKSLTHGFALDVARELVLKLHAELHSAVPPYM